MPYGISQNQPDCDRWAAVVRREDGSFETLACYDTKQEAIDRMVAQSLAEEMQPLGEVGNRQIAMEELLDDVDEMLEGLAEQSEYQINPRQAAMYDLYEKIAEQFGKWGQGVGGDGAHYVAQSPFADEGMVCANCVFYEGGGGCQIVNGQIAPNGICKLWVISETKLVESAEPQEVATNVEHRQISLVAPDFMAASARRGLRLHEEGFSGDGLVAATVADARRMADGEPLSEAKWRKIPAWIARHIGDLDAVQGDEITAGLVAMLLWGGGASKTSARRTQDYAQRIVDRLEAEAENRADAPAPPKDQIKGSDENPAGSAADKTGDISLSDATETALQNKADDHNKRMNDEDKPVWTKVRVGALRSVWRRGAGAFSTSHRPNMTRQQWAMARVNAFLYLAEKGKPENPKYVGDNDLLHPEHPKFSEADRNVGVSDVKWSASMAELRKSAIAENFRWCVKQKDENRFVAFTNLEARQEGEGKKLIGYASVFDSPSEPMPFVEYVRRGAFAKTLNDGADVRLLIDHEGVPLARTRSGTLMLEEDDRGLRVEAMLDPANPDAARVISAMKRGDISQMSFAFRTIKDNWNTDRSVRELKEVQLYDVSVVTFPAYEETVAEIRSGQTPHKVAIITNTVPVRLRSAQIALARRHSRD
jgi:HK97 family phage prohead protease